ncbi:MAG TPA: transcription elongation factor GreB [Acetobacteraceae bacterium]|jgi:transcription elongation factor GreB
MADDDDDDDAPPPAPGTKNYMTPAGHARLRDELNQLMRVERPKIVEIVSWAAGNGDRSENGDYLYGKKRLREIDSRARFLGKRLEIAEVVDPARQQRRDQVFFGARVTYADERDTQRSVTLLGVDEADISRGEISLNSPIARALLGKRVGDAVKIHTPRGIEEIEILEIEYPERPDRR